MLGEVILGGDFGLGDGMMAGARGGVGLADPLEYLRREARPVVLHRDPEPVLVPAQMDRDLGAGEVGRILYDVAEPVHQLGNAPDLGFGRRIVFGEFDGDLHILAAIGRCDVVEKRAKRQALGFVQHRLFSTAAEAQANGGVYQHLVTVGGASALQLDVYAAGATSAAAVVQLIGVTWTQTAGDLFGGPHGGRRGGGRLRRIPPHVTDFEKRLDDLREEALRQGPVEGPGTRAAGGPMPTAGPGYYGRPIVKPPVWTWEIPLYFFTGGLAGMAATIALAAFSALSLAAFEFVLSIAARDQVLSPLFMYFVPLAAIALSAGLILLGVQPKAPDFLTGIVPTAAETLAIDEKTVNANMAAWTERFNREIAR